MAARTPEAARAEFVEALQRALSCLSSAVVVSRGRSVATDPQELTIEAGKDAPLGRDRRCLLTLRLRYLAVGDRSGDWTAVTIAYLYDLLDADSRLVVAYHWHPISQSPIATPHLHLGYEIVPRAYSQVHFPTGFVSPVDLFRFVITELGVLPLRTDWQSVLSGAVGVLRRIGESPGSHP